MVVDYVVERMNIYISEALEKILSKTVKKLAE